MPRPVSTTIAAAAAEQGAPLDLLAVERGRYRFGRRAEGSTSPAAWGIATGRT